ncbi:MAG: hypothetical protein LBG07_06545 [Treponema sp.]|jgi:hypothetical protein|nr:hypothetical protein [Treponema sp.]
MKKLTALFTVLLITTGAAFAQVPDGLSFGGWGRADFVPVQGIFEDDVDPVFRSGVGSGWGPAYTGINIRFSAADGRIGGGADVGRNTAGPAEGDELNIWAKPFGSDILYIKVGQTRDGRFRGPGTDGSFQPFIGGPGKDGDAVFNRFEPDFGALFISQPITGLSIFAQFDAGTDATALLPLAGSEAKDVFKKIQAGIAYDISGIGLARAQWVGNTMNFTPATPDRFEIDPATYTGQGYPTSGTADVPGWKYIKGTTEPTPNAARIEAAFKLTAVEGLNLDIGIKIPIPVKETVSGFDVVHQGNFQVAVAGDFKAGDFGIQYGLYGAFGGSTAVDVPNAKRGKLNPTFDLIVIPSFYIAAVDATVGADLGFKVKGESTTVYSGTKNGDRETIFGFGGWISRDLGKGSIKTGLAYQLPAYAENGIQGQTSYFSWPIILEVSF